MSNRTEAEVTFAAELKAAHLAQIDALTAPGLTRRERVRRFLEAARFPPDQRHAVLANCCECAGCRDITAAYIVWREGLAPYSLFGNLPGCCCPVIEVHDGRADFEGIPANVHYDWSPTAEDLLPFARIQQERRIG
jgi:hypothetical protein